MLNPTPQQWQLPQAPLPPLAGSRARGAPPTWSATPPPPCAGTCCGSRRCLRQLARLAEFRVFRYCWAAGPQRAGRCQTLRSRSSRLARLLQPAAFSQHPARQAHASVPPRRTVEADVGPLQQHVLPAAAVLAAHQRRVLLGAAGEEGVPALSKGCGSKQAPPRGEGHLRGGLAAARPAMPAAVPAAPVPAALPQQSGATLALSPLPLTCRPGATAAARRRRGATGGTRPAPPRAP